MSVPKSRRQFRRLWFRRLILALGVGGLTTLGSASRPHGRVVVSPTLTVRTRKLRKSDIRLGFQHFLLPASVWRSETLIAISTET
jgi:hypothetical protein